MTDTTYTTKNNSRARRLVPGVLLALEIIGFLVFYVLVCSISV